ncbi:MAG: methyltransferase domain-containing protein [Ignavibacteriaceae bacterium]
MKTISLVERKEWIYSHIIYQRVLHAGATDYPITKMKADSDQLLHIQLQGKCKQLVGIDIEKTSIKFLQKEYGITDIIEGDLEKLTLYFEKNYFDLVIAGDVIEHISNIGLFFNGAREILLPEGKLIITVPNTFSIKRFLGVIFLRQERNHPDHLYHFSPMNLQQAAWRFGFEIIEMASFIYSDSERKVNQRVNKIVQGILWITRNNFLADELAIVMKKRV